MRWKARMWAATIAAFLLVPVVSQAQVHGWEGTITIPTYQLGPADPNPAFPLVSHSPVYPYTMLDNLTDRREPQTYRALYLENEYLKITILPQLGGHVYSVYDKINHREMLYRDHVIKYGLVGPRGAWIAGGMEFSFPFAHTTDTVSPVESVLRKNSDGSVTAVVGALDWVSNMHWEIAITLRPHTARLEEGVTLFNATPENHLYLFWTNTAVKATDDAHYIYPMRETVFDDPFAIVQSWPEWEGVDRSWYKNDPDALAIFGRDVHRNFFGIYYEQSKYGVVHVADYREDPGKKFWTWGTARSGKIWDKILSDEDGSYNEIQSGRFYTQGSREFLNPRRVQQWTEYWYPVHDLTDGFVEATKQMAINVDFENGQAKVQISPVTAVQDATLVVRQGFTVLKQFEHVNLEPMKTADFPLPVQNLDDARKTLQVEVLSAKGERLLAWDAAAPIDGNTDLKPSVGKPLKTPLQVTGQTPVEELYLQGVFQEKTEDPHGAVRTFREVLRRDPGYVPALLKLVWYDYDTARWDDAEPLLADAVARDEDDPSIHYAAGVLYRAEGKLSLAKNAFWTSIHYGANLPPGPTLEPSYVELGEIAIQEHEFQSATSLLRQAVGNNQQDAFAQADLAVAERLAGESEASTRDAATAVEKMPLLPYALAEQAMSGQAASNNGWTNPLNNDPQNYLAVAAWYHRLGVWQSSDAVLQAGIHKLNTADVSPMFYYYLASNARAEGRAQDAKQAEEQAAKMPGAEIFPNRMTDAAVLQEAITANPADVNAKYALGNFLFAHDRYEEGALMWSKALQHGMQSPVLWRNLGVYTRFVQKDLDAAASDYRHAIALAPDDYRLYTDLDEIYEQQGDTAAREALFAKAPAAVLDQDTVRARRALLKIEQGQPDAALAILANHHFKPWEGGVVIHNMFVLANLEKGKQALRNKQYPEAEAAFRRAMLYPEELGTGEPNHPDNSEALYWLGNAQAAAGKASEAQASWKQAAKEKTVSGALALRKLGETAQASTVLDDLIHTGEQPDATAPEAYTAGLAEQANGNTDGARADFGQALRKDPQFWQARIALHANGDGKAR